MPSLCIYFKIHQPPLIGKNGCGMYAQLKHAPYITEREVINYLADEYYLPANRALYSKIAAHDGKLKLAFSISGSTLELFKKYRPDVVVSFSQLIKTGCVDILGETYNNSLSSLYSPIEFERQVARHSNLINEVFYVKPSVFMNTAFVHNNNIARKVQSLGFSGILCGVDEYVLNGRSAYKVYSVPQPSSINLIICNKIYNSFFQTNNGGTSAQCGPINYADCLSDVLCNYSESSVTNILLDYKVVRQILNEGFEIDEYLKSLAGRTLPGKKWQFVTPTGVITNMPAVDEYSVPPDFFNQNLSPVINSSDNSKEPETFFKSVFELEHSVKATGERKLIQRWECLQDYSFYQHGLLHLPATIDGYDDYLSQIDELRKDLDLYSTNNQQIKNLMPQRA